VILRIYLHEHLIVCDSALVQIVHLGHGLMDHEMSAVDMHGNRHIVYFDLADTDFRNCISIRCIFMSEYQWL